MDSADIGRSIIGRPSAMYVEPRVEEINLSSWIVSQACYQSLTVREVAGRLTCGCLLFEERQICWHVEAVQRHTARPG